MNSDVYTLILIYNSCTNYEVSRLLDVIYDLPNADNNLIINIVDDKGVSSEGGLEGSLNDVKGFNGISTPIVENLMRIDKTGGPYEQHFPIGRAFVGIRLSNG